MKILSVSDFEDRQLERLIEARSKKLSGVDFIFSCGDLPKQYLEYLTVTLKKKLFFIVGNHYVSDFYERAFSSPVKRRMVRNGLWHRHNAGGTDLHAHAERIDNYIVVGFGGAMKYGPGYFQFSEKEMTRLVKRAIRAVRAMHLADLLLFRKRKNVIVISHAPVEGIHDKQDRCHNGFACFKLFIEKTKPLAWIHGHIHPEGREKIRQTEYHNTLIINTVPSRVIEFKNDMVCVEDLLNL